MLRALSGVAKRIGRFQRANDGKTKHPRANWYIKAVRKLKKNVFEVGVLTE
jgi:hypothetical protein